MIQLNADFRDLLACLNSSGVRYLVIGGYAVNYYGHHRNTKDIDIWIAIEPDNARRVAKAMETFGFASRNVSYTRFLEPKSVHSFGREPFRVDILANPSGVDFETCYARRIEATLEGVRIPFISIEDLKVNKRASGRLRDLDDLEKLSSKKHAKRSAGRKKK